VNPIARQLARGCREARASRRSSPRAADDTRHSGHLDAPGFTLLEIAVVIFIMGLIMSLAMPYFGGFHNAELKSEARKLAGRASYLYDEASAQKVIYRMTFDLDHNAYFVTRLDPYAAKPKFTPFTGLWDGQVLMPPGVKLRDVSVEGIGGARAGAISCQFYPDGYADATVIHLATDGGKVLTLSINPLTGNVAIVSGDVPPTTALAMAQ
jgi:prepilin-type N-terminal cleavage/methylation domain-containing protein